MWPAKLSKVLMWPAKLSTVLMWPTKLSTRTVNIVFFPGQSYVGRVIWGSGYRVSKGSVYSVLGVGL